MYHVYMHSVSVRHTHVHIRLSVMPLAFLVVVVSLTRTWPDGSFVLVVQWLDSNLILTLELLKYVRVLRVEVCAIYLLRAYECILCSTYNRIIVFVQKTEKQMHTHSYTTQSIDILGAVANANVDEKKSVHERKTY